MKNTTPQDDRLAKAFGQLLNLVVFLVLVIVGLVMALLYYIPAPVAKPTPVAPQPDQNGNFTEAARKAAQATDTTHYWQAPDINQLSEGNFKDQVLLGKDIVVNTAKYYGTQGLFLKNATNGMNCQNCHLDAGTRVFGNNYGAVASTYPKYRARSGSIENIYKRINDCFERSLNGNHIDTASQGMKALATYILWLGSNVQKNKKAEGAGFKQLAFLSRAANPNNGKDVYAQKCQSCHQANGSGQLNGDKTAYTYPPLWGEHSYNTGAGLYRLSNFARFVKYNMPLGALHTSTQLTDEEAWDVAAFVNSQPRPVKPIKNDWPKIEEKPYDHPYGPYADGFSEEQHKYGPFAPIQEKLEALRKKKT